MRARAQKCSGMGASTRCECRAAGVRRVRARPGGPAMGDQRDTGGGTAARGVACGRASEAPKSEADFGGAGSIEVEATSMARVAGEIHEGSNMALRLGDLLVIKGVLSRTQRDAVLKEQEGTGRPFGEIAEQMFGVSSDLVEDAWAQQYALLSGLIDPRSEAVDSEAVGRLGAEEAWQNEVLPMRHDGRELMVCTTREGLVRALSFMDSRVRERCYFVLAERAHLHEALATHYPKRECRPPRRVVA